MQFNFEGKVVPAEVIKDLALYPQAISQVFADLPPWFNLFYKDEAGDFITISHQEDLSIFLEDGAIPEKMVLIAPGEKFRRVEVLRK